ncbi:MAG: metallophosphoesterase [Pseudonocardiaceae bacterium]
MTVRIAAVGDVHLAPDTRGTLRPALAGLAERADVLLLAGDLTRHGSIDEAEVVAEEFGDLEVPVLAVLGNHDYHCDAQHEITVMLGNAGMEVLEGNAKVLRAGGSELAVAGVKGFGGGFAGKSGSAFGEREMKAFIEHTELAADRLATALREVEGAEILVALTHYAPVPDTLRGEPFEIYPFLGAYQLGEAIDGARGGSGADLAIHGHAHFGSERGCTPGAVQVRNVAQPVIRAAYAVYHLAGR